MRLADAGGDLFDAVLETQAVAIRIAAQVNLLAFDHDPQSLMRKEEDADQTGAEHGETKIDDIGAGVILNRKHVRVRHLLEIREHELVAAHGQKRRLHKWRIADALNERFSEGPGLAAF